MQKILKNRVIASILIGIIISLVLSIFSINSIFQTWNLKLADSLYTINAPSEDIIIVSIDERSTQPAPFGFGRYTQWTRDNYARALDNLIKAEPKVITFDIVYNNPTQNISIKKIKDFRESLDLNLTNAALLEQYKEFIENNSNLQSIEEDNFFAEKIAEAGNVILPFLYSEGQWVGPISKFAENATLASVSAVADEDGVFRTMTPHFYQEDVDLVYENIAVTTVKKFLEIEEIEIPLEDDKMIINYFADPFGYQKISFVDVVNGIYSDEMFRDKIVLIGVTSFKEVQDSALTPKSNKAPMAGVEVHANTIQTILDGAFLQNQSTLSQILTITGIAVGLTVALNYLGILLSIVLAVLAIGAYILAAHWMYSQGTIMNMVYPFIAIVLAYLGSWVYKYFIADKKKREIKSAFGHYVSEELVEQIAKNPDLVKLGGEKRTVTVFFSDIKNSTTLSEKTNIESWVSQVNEYFTVMEKILKKYGGTLDKYEGDAIMGFWNAPIAQTDHIVRAYVTALEMQKTLKLLNQKWQKEGKPAISIRIGINTGEAIVGNFGSADRFDYTVMGDTVNTASRLESSANKAYGTSLIVAGFAESDKELLSKVVMRELDTVILPGKEEPVKLFELVCIKQEMTPEIEKFIRTYTSGLIAYRKKDFDTANVAFRQLPDDPASQLLLKRIDIIQKGQQVAGLDENMIFKVVGK